MAKTGNNRLPGTAEGAALGRAMHALYSDNPILDDFWAMHLLTKEDREQILAREQTTQMHAIKDFDASGIFAINVGCLRYAEDEVLRCIENGTNQYLILGAGLDTFALRRGDMRDDLRIYELDYPDVQILKQQRINLASAVPASLPRFIPTNFETQSLAQVISNSDFKFDKPCVVSWVNTLHYLSEEAIHTALGELAHLMTAGSRLILNYAPDVPFSEDQIDFVAKLLEVVDAAGEPMRSRWQPARFDAMLENFGFRIVEHIDEKELTARYFSNRNDTLKPAMPLRALVAERLPESSKLHE